MKVNLPVDLGISKTETGCEYGVFYVVVEDVPLKITYACDKLIIERVQQLPEWTVGEEREEVSAEEFLGTLISLLVLGGGQ